MNNTHTYGMVAPETVRREVGGHHDAGQCAAAAEGRRGAGAQAPHQHGAPAALTAGLLHRTAKRRLY